MRLVETNFLSSRNSIALFRDLLKILKFEGSNLFKRKIISARKNWSFLLVEVNFFHFSDTPASESRNVFWANFSFRTVETYFLSCGKRFLLFNLFFYKWKPSLKLVETNLCGKDFVLVEMDFPPSGNCFLLFRTSFLQVETVTETSWNK